MTTNNSHTAERLTAEVNAVYDQYRTSLLNVKYYGGNLKRVKRLNFWLELVLAAAAPGAVGSWALWRSSEWGIVFSGGLAVLAGILALAKPLLQLSAQIERYTRLYVSYGEIACELERLVEEIGIEQAMSPEMVYRYRHQAERMGRLSHLDDPKPNRTVLTRIQKEVNEEIPADNFWIPQVVEK